VLTRRAGKWPLSSKLSDVVKRLGFVLGVLLVLTTADSTTPNNHQEWARYEARLRLVSSVEREIITGHAFRSPTTTPVDRSERRRL